MKDGVEVRHDCDTCISTVETQTVTKTSFLQITPYVNEDFGEYECRVRNKYGSSKLKISLKKCMPFFHPRFRDHVDCTDAGWDHENALKLP